MTPDTALTTLGILQALRDIVVALDLIAAAIACAVAALLGSILYDYVRERQS